MSKVEVNQVTQQCGTTLTVGGGACKTAVVDATTVTLGRCGATVSLASGATQSGFGRTGTVDWITTPKVTGDSPVTGVTGKGYFLNTTAGTITINLPAGAAGSIVSMSDYARTWDTNAVTVSPNGSEKIGGGVGGDTAILNTAAQSVTLVYVDSTQGWVNIQDSTSGIQGGVFIVATGGTPCTGAICGDCKVHTFTGPGTFCVSQISSTAGNNAVAYTVVGAGGGSGSSGGNSAGGGGAGGFREGRTNPITPYTASPLAAACSGITVTASPYAIVVGAGGAGAPGNGGPAPETPGTAGNLSSFSTISSAGGGFGAGPSPGVGGDGGSGGGGAGGGFDRAGGAGDTPNVTPDQGFPGGTSATPGGSDTSGGGGGGASAAGTPGTNCTSGSGGNGVTTEISGASVIRGGGGAGGAQTPAGKSMGCAGTGGGGGTNDNAAGDDGTVNTGGGAGAPSSSASADGATGGSGVVIIRYKFQ